MMLVSSTPVSIEEKIKAETFRLGFSLCGFSSSKPLTEFPRYQHWIESGLHSGMEYLSATRHLEPRQHPSLLMSDVKTILSLGWSYPIRTELKESQSREAWIAGYASGKDYHLLLPEKLESLAAFIRAELGDSFHYRCFTDSAAILERELAARAGLGWIGKNSCLISPQVGSAFFLAELFTNYPFKTDQNTQDDRCGKCTRCLEACPTGCILPDRTIDARKCISYHTIENKGRIPDDFRASTNRWIFGCDICQMVCPWNIKNAPHDFSENLQNWPYEQLLDFLDSTVADFTSRFFESAMMRTKWKGLMRNTLIALGNMGESSAIARLDKFIPQTSDVDLVDAAQWAITRIKNINEKNINE